MRNRLFRVIGTIVVGGMFQFGGCDSQNLADIVADHVRSTIVDVGTFVLESGADRALGIVP